VVTKVPRFDFEKFSQADNHLTTQMKSVGEVMAIGSTFQESLHKALRGLEIGVDGLDERSTDRDEIVEEIGEPGPHRLWYVADAFRIGMSREQVFEETAIDPWFLAEIEQLVLTEQRLAGRALSSVQAEDWLQLKRMGFSDRRLARLLAVGAGEVRRARRAHGVRPVYKRVIPAPLNFQQPRRTCTRLTRSNAKPSPRTGARWWCSAAARTGSGRASNSTIAASMRRWRCAKTDSRPS